MRLNPRSLGRPYTTLTLREALETLEHEGITIRVLARSLADGARAGRPRTVRWRIRRPGACWPRVLREISSAVRAYGCLAVTQDGPDREGLESELERQLTAARDRQAELGELVRTGLVDRSGRLAAARRADEPPRSAQARTGGDTPARAAPPAPRAPLRPAAAGWTGCAAPGRVAAG